MRMERAARGGGCLGEGFVKSAGLFWHKDRSLESGSRLSIIVVP